MDLSRQILEVLIAHGRPMSVRLLAVSLRVSREALKQRLVSLAASGQVEVFGEGQVSLLGVGDSRRSPERVVIETLRLVGGTMSVSDLARATGLLPATVSQCVRGLRRARILVQPFKGKFRLRRPK
ncbi:MAG: helix-turn-helix domain-containing protein [Polyangiaceae bacterium]